MRAAVVGTNWGRVHVAALRANGVDVVALCGLHVDRTRAVADEERVPVAVDDPRALLDMGLDVVTVATPPETRSQLLATLAAVPVICEKPLLGMTGDAAPLAEAGVVWVNYAFPFLDSARTAANALAAAGPVRRVDIDVAHDLSLSLSPAAWLLEVGSHPLSYAVHLFGRPHPAGPALDVPPPDAAVDLLLGEDGVPLRLSCRHVPGLAGIAQRVTVDTGRGALDVRGAFRRGQPWRYDPVTLDGVPLDAGVADDEDCWFRANRHSIGAALAAIRGDLTPAAAVEAGCTDLAAARAIDDCVRAAYA